MQLSRESISHAALGILDTYGLADVTMRRVASTLGVAPGALYWHIENKQELISAIATLIVGSLVDAPGTETLTPDELCARLRGVLLAHRDGAEVVISAMSQPESPVAATLSGMMLEAVERDAAAHGANEGASASALRAAADGLLYLTLARPPSTSRRRSSRRRRVMRRVMRRAKWWLSAPPTTSAPPPRSCSRACARP